jgi:hypothetical protein
MWVPGKLSPESVKRIESDNYASDVVSIRSKEKDYEKDGAYYDKGLAGMRHAADLLEMVDPKSGKEFNKLLDDVLEWEITEEEEEEEGNYLMTVEQSRKALSLVKDFKDLRLRLHLIINEDNRIHPDKVSFVKNNFPHLLLFPNKYREEPKYWIEHPLWYAEVAILLLEAAVDSHLEIWFG